MLVANIFTQVFLIALLCKNLIESFLDKRNINHIVKNRSAVPEKFISQISLVDHQKAADYSVEKIKINKYFHLFELVIFLLWTLKVSPSKHLHWFLFLFYILWSLTTLVEDYIT